MHSATPPNDRAMPHGDAHGTEREGARRALQSWVRHRIGARSHQLAQLNPLGELPHLREPDW